MNILPYLIDQTSFLFFFCIGCVPIIPMDFYTRYIRVAIAPICNCEFIARDVETKARQKTNKRERNVHDELPRCIVETHDHF